MVWAYQRMSRRFRWFGASELINVMPSIMVSGGDIAQASIDPLGSDRRISNEISYGYCFHFVDLFCWFSARHWTVFCTFFVTGSRFKLFTARFTCKFCSSPWRFQILLRFLTGVGRWLTTCGRLRRWYPLPPCMYTSHNDTLLTQGAKKRQISAVFSSFEREFFASYVCTFWNSSSLAS